MAGENIWRRIIRFSNVMRIISIGIIVALLISYFTPLVHPKNLWILPFFGLAYPITIVVAILTIFYWVILKSIRWSVVLTILLLFGIPYMNRLIGWNDTEKKIEHVQTSIKVLSNNVQIFDLYDENREKKYETRDSIFNYAITENPDIVCFQEFYSKDNPTDFSTYALFRKQFGAVDSHHRFIYKKVGRQHFGVALFSKLPIIAKGEVIFEMEDDKNYNFCIYVDVVKNTDTFRIYNVHLQSFRISRIDYEREEKSSVVKQLVERLRNAYPRRADQALRVTEHIATSPYPVVICGDFNDTPVSFVYSRFANQLKDAFLESSSGIGSTYVGKLPAGRIDYIFHSPSLIASDFKIQEHAISDHRAISCVINKISENE